MKNKSLISILFVIVAVFVITPLCGQNDKSVQKSAQKSKQTAAEKPVYNGFQLPALNEKQRDSIAEKKQGLVIFNITTNRPQFYDGSTWINFTNERYIGEHYGGGIVFYIDESGKHGLIAAPYDQSFGIAWGNFKNPVETYDTEIGIGRYNTKKIVSFSDYNDNAASICYNLELNGYKDWFLPSKDELHLMYHNLKAAGIGKFAERFYWTSSETDFGNAWIYDFQTGLESEQGITKFAYVRAIRAF